MIYPGKFEVQLFPTYNNMYRNLTIVPVTVMCRITVVNKVKDVPTNVLQLHYSTEFQLRLN